MSSDPSTRNDFLSTRPLDTILGSFVAEIFEKKSLLRHLKSLVELSGGSLLELPMNHV